MNLLSLWRAADRLNGSPKDPDDPGGGSHRDKHPRGVHGEEGQVDRQLDPRPDEAEAMSANQTCKKISFT